jgi:hypothetical protein
MIGLKYLETEAAKRFDVNSSFFAGDLSRNPNDRIGCREN